MLSFSCVNTRMEKLKRIFTDQRLMSSIFIVAYCLYDWNSMILWCLLAVWIVNNTVPLIVHEGWSHNYIKPRFKLLGYLLDLYAYAITTAGNSIYSNKTTWKIPHIRHHQYWKGEYDHVQWELRNNTWFTLMFAGSSRDQYPNLNSLAILRQSKKRVYRDLTPWEIWVDENNRLVKSTIHLLFFLAVGWEIYFYMLLVPSWSAAPWIYFFTELLAHWKKEKQEDEYNKWWLFPIAGCNAFHYSHHACRDELHVGRGIFRYLHINYWFIRLFYKQLVPMQ